MKTLTKDQVVDADYYWLQDRIFRHPIATIICGSCGAKFDTTEWVNFHKDGRVIGSVVYCQCRMWNFFPYYV